jgi:uncharacterized protein
MSSRYSQFFNCIKDLIHTPTVRSMGQIPQHVNVNCLDHSIYVSYISFLISRFFRLDYVASARGALLHDLFLYDWRIEEDYKKKHLFSHPSAALNNATKAFELTEIEKDIIKKHMWPLTLTPPRYMESFVVGCADKFCALMEMLFVYKAMNMGDKLKSNA